MAKNLIEVIIRAQDDASKKMLAVSQATEKMADRIQSVSRVVAVGGAAITAAVAGVIYKTAQWADNLRDLSQRLGVSTEFLSQLEYALQTTGGSIDSFAIAMKVLSTNALDAANGSKTAKELFDDLGVSFTDNNGKLKDSERLFLEVADAIARTKSDTERLAVASKIFGRGAGELIPLLRGGSDGIRELMGTAKQLGVTLTQDAADKADAFNDALIGIRASIKGAGLALMTEFSPQLTQFSNKLATETIPKIAEWIKKHDELVKSLGAVTLGMTGLSIAINALGPVIGLFVRHPLGLLIVALGAVGMGFDKLNQRVKETADNMEAMGGKTYIVKDGQVYLENSAKAAEALGRAIAKVQYPIPPPWKEEYRNPAQELYGGIRPEPRTPSIPEVAGIAAPGGKTQWPDEGINRAAAATERWRQSVFDVKNEMQQIPELVNRNAERMAWMANQFAVTWEGVASQVTESLSDAFMVVLEGGKDMWKNLEALGKQFVKTMIHELIRLAIWKLITKLAFFSGGGEYGPPIPVAQGQSGLEAVGGRWGKDTIPAVISRGEVVMPSPTVERLNQFIDRGSAQGGGISLYTLFYSGSRDEANQAGSYIDRKRASFSKCIVEGTL